MDIEYYCQIYLTKAYELRRLEHLQKYAPDDEELRLNIEIKQEELVVVKELLKEALEDED